MRILNPVEHDDERRLARAPNKVRHVVAFDRSQLSSDPLVDATMGQSIEFARRHSMNRDARTIHRFDSVDHPTASSFADAQFLDATGTERFENRIDAVDQHVTDTP